jgi:hypothetical protein
MGYDLEEKTAWYLITIDDPDFLPGKSIFDILKIIQDLMPFKYVILDYMFGAGKNEVITKLKDKKNIAIKIEDLLEVLCDVDQFEWGDFFLFQEYPKNWTNPKKAPYPYVIAQSDTTVRAVDNQYIYIYTPYQKLVEAIKKNYNPESLKTDFLEHLDYPE